MITIIDYGMGNLRSVQKAFEFIGCKTCVTNDPLKVSQAERLVLPGVGAMQPAMQELERLGLIGIIKEAVCQRQTPFLGICLGLQLLFEQSQEGGQVQGLGMVHGDVHRFSADKPKLKVPQMGWNQLTIKRKDCPLFEGITEPAYVYFCHSYFVAPANRDCVAAMTDYGAVFASSIWQDNIFGVQFHPEKSQEVGLRILRNFAKWK